MYTPQVSNVVRYGYRKAMPAELVLRVPRSYVSSLEEKLAKQTGSPLDNHVCFEFNMEPLFDRIEGCGINRDPDLFLYGRVSVWFHDLTATFGRGIRLTPDY